MIDYSKFAWQIKDGPPRDEVMAQLPDIFRLPYTQRPSLEFVVDSPECRGKTRMRLLGLVSVDGMRLLVNGPGDLWEIQGFASGELGGQYAKGVFDTRRREGGLDVVNIPTNYLGAPTQRLYTSDSHP